MGGQRVNILNLEYTMIAAYYSLRRFIIFLQGLLMKFLVALIFFTMCSSVSGQVCRDIIAGQNEVAGEVCVDIVGDNIVVSYQTDGGWELEEFHLFVGESIADMPSTKKGSPKNGKFPYRGFGDEDTAVVLISDEELGVGSFADLECLAVAAHSVVSKIDADGNVIQTETGWAEGKELPGNNWAMYFDVCVCEEEYFDKEGLEYALGEEEVKIRVSYNGGNSAKPYFYGSIDFDKDGTYDLTGLDTNCIDLGNTIASNRDYCAIIKSSYDSDVELLPAIVSAENMDLANYVLNTYKIGDLLNGEVITGGTIQRVMWRLIYSQGQPNGSNGSGAYSLAQVEFIYADALENGEAYEPPCTGVVGVVLYPTNCETDQIKAQALVAQVLISQVPSACSTRYVVCEVE